MFQKEVSKLNFKGQKEVARGFEEDCRLALSR